MKYYKNPLKNIFNLQFIGINILCTIILLSLYFYLDKTTFLVNTLNLYLKILSIITFITLLTSFIFHLGVTDKVEKEELDFMLKEIYYIDTTLLQLFCIRFNIIFITSIIAICPKYILTIY